MKKFLENVLLTLVESFFRCLPRGAALFTGRYLGRLVYHLARGRRRTALRNLDIAFGEGKTQSEKAAIAKESFENLGKSAVEFLQVPYLDKKKLEDLVSLSGEDKLRTALSKGRGVLLLSAHLGNWELFGVAMAARGYPAAVITKISGSDAVNRLWMGYREDAGIRILKGRGLLKDTFRHLNDGGIVGFVIDQNARIREGVFVPFFDRQACTLKSLALLARRTGSPVVPAYIRREGTRHHIVIEDALYNETSEDLDRDIVNWTETYTAWTERVIRMYPEQWTWLHDRWKTRPKKSPESRVQSSEGKNN
jgi:KDO2-lipid IV(A) lauroyltransferase